MSGHGASSKHAELAPTAAKRHRVDPLARQYGGCMGANVSVISISNAAALQLVKDSQCRLKVFGLFQSRRCENHVCCLVCQSLQTR